MSLRVILSTCVVAAAFVAGTATGQDKGDLQERLAAVRREVKHIDLTDALDKLPGLLKREEDYLAVLAKLATANTPADRSLLLNQGRQMKVAALAALNDILKKHKGEHAGLTEEEVWKRLTNARFRNVTYDNQWLVNILDDLEEQCQINFEMDARIYKFDTVTINFDKTSARAMLQIMGDELLFNWIVRGDTIYVYKETHEKLFGGEWIRKKKAAFKARQAALKRAEAEAQKRALEDDDK